MASKGNFKVKRHLILPVLKLEDGVPVHVQITDKMHKSAAQANPGKTADGKEKEVTEPATVCHVTNLDTGEQQTLICGTVLERVLNETYPDGKYVGLGFRIVKYPRAKGKRYNTYGVDEIEIEIEIPK